MPCSPNRRRPGYRAAARLGLHPGVDIDAYAAAALAGVALDEAAGHLDGLHGDHLLEERVYRRYRMHDLIRAYAHTLGLKTDPIDVREEALGRLLDFYQHTATRADNFLARYTRPAATTMASPAATPELASGEQAAAWLRTERTNLLACIHHTITRQQHDRTIGLTAGIAALLRTDGPWTDAVIVHEAAAMAADRLGDRHAHANALHEQAVARQLAGDYPAAADLLNRTLGLYQAVDDRLGQANAHYELGVVRWLTGDYPAAADLLNRTLDGYQAVGDRRGQANALTWLGTVQWATGDYPVAADLLNRALDLYQVVGDRRGEANALNELGVVRRLTGDYPATAEVHQEALTLSQAPGNTLGQAIALNHLGVVRSLTGDHPTAAQLLDQARNLHRTLGHRHGEAIATTRLAVVKYLTGDYTGAADLLHQALAVLRKVGAPDDEAEALNHLATVHRLTGRPAQARALYCQAKEIARRIHHDLEEARALEGIGRAWLHHGDTITGLSHLRQALDIYRQLGVPEATQVAADLTTLTPNHGPARATELLE